MRLRLVGRLYLATDLRTWCRCRALGWPLVDDVLGPVLPVGDATALGTFRTRLETRTKESNMCASHWDLKAKPKGAMKVKVRFYARPREDGSRYDAELALPGRLALIAS